MPNQTTIDLYAKAVELDKEKDGGRESRPDDPEPIQDISVQ